MPAKSTNPPIEAILVDCALATGRGVGTKKIALGAVEFWAATYEKTIANALVNGGVWKDDRKAVLLMSVKLGRVARRIAGSGPITKVHAKRASKIISNDPTCGAGGGRYCPPSSG